MEYFYVLFIHVCVYEKEGQSNLKLFFISNCKKQEEEEAPRLLSQTKLSVRLNFLSNSKARNES